MTPSISSPHDQVVIPKEIRKSMTLKPGQRLKKEGNETVTICHGLKMTAANGNQRMTDVADTEQLLRLIHSVPSPKALS